MSTRTIRISVEPEIYAIETYEDGALTREPLYLAENLPMVDSRITVDVTPDENYLQALSETGELPDADVVDVKELPKWAQAQINEIRR